MISSFLQSSLKHVNDTNPHSHTQLRYNNIHQAKTLAGIYETQVLDKLTLLHRSAVPIQSLP